MLERSAKIIYWQRKRQNQTYSFNYLNLNIMKLKILIIISFISFCCSPPESGYNSEGKVPKATTFRNGSVTESLGCSSTGGLIRFVLGGEWKGNRIEQGDIAEWIMERFHIPVEEYRKVAATFNPVRFNAREWVALAKDAGMKYIIITSKHHDGFAMFNSKVSDYNIVDYTPFKT